MNSKPKAPASPKEPIDLTDDDIEPPSKHEAIQDDFARALMAGDAAAAAKALRKLKELHSPMLDVLADLFDGDPVYGDLYPYRLKLVPRRRGRPVVDSLTKQAKEQAIAQAVARALKKFGNLEFAVTHVQHQQVSHTGKKMSRSAIIRNPKTSSVKNFGVYEFSEFWILRTRFYLAPHCISSYSVSLQRRVRPDGGDDGVAHPEIAVGS